MNSQRFVYTMPSQDNSTYFLDSDNMSILSSYYSYPEIISPQVILPEPDTLIPYYIYPYPFIQIPAEPVSCVPSFPTFLEPSLTPDAFISSPDMFISSPDPFYDNLTNSIVNSASFFNSVSGSGIMTEDAPSRISVSASGDLIGNQLKNIQYEEHKTFPTITDYGTITILLRHLIRVDVSPTKAVYVTNSPASCIAALNGTGDKSCVIHPNGRIHHIGHDIHMVTLDRMAKICKRGVVFTSSERCISYLVDDSGTKTTSEKLRNLNHDFSLKVFYGNGVAERKIEECYKLVNEAKYNKYKNGDEVWVIGGIRIRQDQRGDVKVTRNGNRYVIQTSPTTGEVSVKTLTVDFSVGRYPDNYFAVRKGDKQVTASLRVFNVRKGNQKAGFNSSGKVVLH